MNVEDREKVEEFWARAFEDRANSCKNLAVDWTNHHSWPSTYASEYILKLTTQAELLKELANELRRPKWIRLESEQYERERNEGML